MWQASYIKLACFAHLKVTETGICNISNNTITKAYQFVILNFPYLFLTQRKGDAKLNFPHQITYYST